MSAINMQSKYDDCLHLCCRFDPLTLSHVEHFGFVVTCQSTMKTGYFVQYFAVKGACHRPLDLDSADAVFWS